MQYDRFFKTFSVFFSNLQRFKHFDMKTIGRIILICSAVLAAACTNKENTDHEPVLPLTLSVDKSTIESDGKDAATLIIKDAEGMILTEGKNLNKTAFHVAETDEWLNGILLGNMANKFTSLADGSYTISGMYDGKYCDNTIKVTSQNRRTYETFHKNVAIYRLTGTWCGYCPQLTTALNGINDFTEDHSVVLEFHNGDEFSVKYDSTHDLASKLMVEFRNTSLPYAIFSLSLGIDTRDSYEIQSIVKDILTKNPAKTGIKARSSVSGDKLTVNATVKASSAGTYDLGFAVIKDDCIPSDPRNATESEYDNAVLGITGNYYAMSTDGTFSLEANGEKEAEFTWTSPIVSTEDIEDCSIVLFTLTKTGNKTIVDNIAEFEIGESVDYRYN